MIDETISHYRILKKLGGGGMGVVYEAEDTRLGRRVALKLLLEHLEPSAEDLERFQREARAASALNHPNICTIYDVGEHRGSPFIVMERMEGRTLKHRIDGNALPIDEVLELGSQIADALEAAHAEGLVHRDVKAANVFITERGQAKLLDFGLVKETGPGSKGVAARELTQTGSMMGTVAYLSPEQAQGEAVDTRTDLFSLGVTLYEMATGRLPFAAGGLMETFRALLEGTPELPSRYNPEVPAELDRIILACLEKDRELRIQHASEVRVTLQRLKRDSTQGTTSTSAAALIKSIAQPAPGREQTGRVPGGQTGRIPGGDRTRGGRGNFEDQDTRPQFRPVRWRRRWIFALPVVLALGIAFQFVRHLGERAGPAPPEPGAGINVRRSVAVLGFQNLGRPADDWLSVAFTEMLSAELAASSKEIRAIAGENVARAKLELTLTGSAALAGDTLARVRSLLGADYVILGSYFAASESKLRLDLNLQDAAAGTTVATLTETGSPDGILEIVSVMGGRLRDELDIGELSEVAAGRARATVSHDPEALRLYSEGLRLIRAYDFIAARARFEQAIEADPDHPLAHAALAETFSALGYDQLALEEAQEAFELSAELSHEDRLFVEGRHHEMAKRWDQAIESYRSLYRIFPDNLDYGLRLAGALTKAGRGKAAIDALERLRQLPAPFSSDLRIELAEAEAAESFSDYRRMLDAGVAAAEKGEALGARILEAGGRLFQASALLRLGDPQQAADAATAARRLFAAAGHRSGEAHALNRLANVSFEAGDYGAAKRIFDDTLEIWRQVGDLKGLITALNNVADTLMMQGDLAAAEPLFKEALGIARERADQVSEALMNVNLADLALRRGDVATARTAGRIAVQIGRDSNYGYGTYTGLRVLGDAALASGELETALEHLEEGLELTRRTGDRRYTAYFLYSLGNLASAGGNLELARRRQEQALEIREELGSRTESAESKVALALLAVDEGQPTAGVTGLEEALEVFNNQGLRENEAHARAALASVALARGRPERASAACRTAEELLAGSQNAAARLWSEIQIARTAAALGELDRASRSLESVLTDARQRGLVVIEYEARLAHAQAENIGSPAAGQGPLLRLTDDAKAIGLLLIARKAAEAGRLSVP